MPRRPKGLTESINELSQTFDTKEIFGESINTRTKREFAESVINLIQTRSNSGKTLFNGNFKKYSKKYADFKGVSRSDVDMTLFGDMLGDLEYEINGDIVKVKVADKDTPKGYNHQVGDTLPKRTWFGATSKDVKEIKSSIDVEPDLNTQEQIEQTQFELEVERLQTESPREIFNEVFNDLIGVNLDGES